MSRHEKEECDRSDHGDDDDGDDVPPTDFTNCLAENVMKPAADVFMAPVDEIKGRAVLSSEHGPGRRYRRVSDETGDGEQGEMDHTARSDFSEGLERAVDVLFVSPIEKIRKACQQVSDSGGERDGDSDSENDSTQHAGNKGTVTNGNAPIEEESVDAAADPPPRRVPAGAESGASPSNGPVAAGVVDDDVPTPPTLPRGACEKRELPVDNVGKGKQERVIVLPPVVEFLVRDSTILTAAALTALVLTLRHWQAISDDRALPLPAAAAWLLLAFLLGQKRSVESIFDLESKVAEEHTLRAYMNEDEEMVVHEEDEGKIAPEELDRLVGKVNSSIVAEIEAADTVLRAVMGPTAEEGTKPLKGKKMRLRPKLQRKGESRWRRNRRADAQQMRATQQERRHSVFVMAVQKMTSKKIVFEEEVEPSVQEEGLPSEFWTTLLNMPSRERQTWEMHSAETCEPLTKRLLKDPGRFPRSTLGDKEVIKPLLKFRGLDVFLSDAEETELSQREILTKCGLRDKPTAMMHLLCPFASIVTYFELPDWVNTAEGTKENVDDPEDVKALKRFINGDDEYRNKRLKIYPCLIKGPMAVRMLFYPPSKEFTIWGTMLPLRWYEQKPTTNRDSRKESLVMEGCVDVVSNGLVRQTANLLGGSLKNLEIDIAVVIGTPDGQKEAEPEVLLGMWRYDHIDLRTCPRLPPKTKLEKIKHASELRNTLELSVAA